MLNCLRSNTLHLHHRFPNPNPRLYPTRVDACSHIPDSGIPATSPSTGPPSLHSLSSQLNQDPVQRPWHSRQLTRLAQMLCSLSSHGTPCSREMVAGSIGIAFAVASITVGLRFMWKKASELTWLPPRYEFVVDFPLASGITTGTPVKLRGVDIGSVIRVRPCLERIDTHIQVFDSSVYIPRNAVIEVNQSGLAGETMIDIMPVIPVPRPSIGPLHPNCRAEGLIVCDKQSVSGKQGVSMDDLIGLCGKMAKKSEDTDLAVLFKTANQLVEILDNCKPLFQKTEAFLNDTEAVIEALQNNGVLKDLTGLLQLLNHTTNVLRKSSLRTEDSVHFSQEVARLATMLKCLEDNLKDASNFTGDEKKQREIKHLIEILSRLVNA